MDDRYLRQPTGSLTDAEVLPPLAHTSQEAKGQRAAWIAMQARNAFGSYPRDEFADPENFLYQLGTILERYPDEVIADITSPLTGIQRRCRKAPSIAHIVEACDDEMARRERVKRYSAMGRSTPPPRIPSRRANVFVGADRPQYPAMVERAKTADQRDYCYDAKGPGIWIPLGWLDKQVSASAREFGRFTKEDLERIYKRNDEAAA